MITILILLTAQSKQRTTTSFVPGFKFLQQSFHAERTRKPVFNANNLSLKKWFVEENYRISPAYINGSMKNFAILSNYKNNHH